MPVRGVRICCAGGFSSCWSISSISGLIQLVSRGLRGRHEHLIGQLHAVGAEMLQVRGADAGGGVIAHCAAVTGDADLAESENPLKRALAVLRAGYLGDTAHLP